MAFSFRMPDLSAFLSYMGLFSMKNLYLGEGFPWALQVIVIRLPSLTVSSGASVVILVSLGESAINQHNCTIISVRFSLISEISHLHSWVNRGKVKVKCHTQNHNIKTNGLTKIQVQKVDNTYIRGINHYPVDSMICFISTYCTG